MKGLFQDVRCKDCDLFCRQISELDEQSIEKLDQHKRVISFKRGETIFKQFTFVSHIVFLREGLVKLIIEGTNGKNLIVKLICPNEFLGFSLLFGENYSHFTATALTEAKVCMIEKNYFRELVEANPRLNQKVFEWFSEDYKLIFSKLAILGTKQLHGRLAETILYLSQEGFSRHKIFSHITRKDLADFSGMSPESMMRLLNEFKNDKLINVNGKQITINDYEMLKKLSIAG